MTREEAEDLVGKHVTKGGFAFWFMVNKTAAVFRRADGALGVVLGQQDGVQADPEFVWSFICYREHTVVYDAKLSVN